MGILSNHIPCNSGWKASVTQTRPSGGIFVAAFACCRCWKLYSVVVIAGRHVCMFRMHGCKSTGPVLMKLTTIRGVSHMIGYTRAFLSLIFFWGHGEEGLGTRLVCYRNLVQVLGGGRGGGGHHPPYPRIPMALRVHLKLPFTWDS